MNWKIRLKNPVFWVQVLTGALATVLAYSGLTAADMTTWAGLWGYYRRVQQSVLPVSRGVERVECAE